MYFFQRQSLLAVLAIFFLTISLSAIPPIKKCWEINGGGKLFLPAASDNDNALAYLLDDGLGLNSIGPGGKLNWSAALPEILNDSVIVSDDGVFVLMRKSDESVSLVRLSTNTGLTLATTSFPANISGRVPQLLRRSGGLFVAFESEILAVDADGSILSGRRFDSAVYFIQSPLSNRVFVRFADGGLAEVVIRDQKIELETLGFKTLSADRLVEEDGRLLLTDRTGRVRLYNRSFGKIWEMRAGAGIQTLIPFAESILITSNDNFVYLLNKSSGDIRWRFRTGGRSFGVKHEFESKIYFFIGEISGGIVFLLDSAGQRLSEIELSEEEMIRSMHLSRPGRVVIASNKRVMEYTLGECK